jgi:hypothetical protein
MIDIPEKPNNLKFFLWWFIYPFLIFLFFGLIFPAKAEYDPKDPNADPTLDLKADKKDIFQYDTYLNDKRDLEVIYQYTTVEVPATTGENINKRTETSQTFDINDNKHKTFFYTGTTFKKTNDVWLQVETATTTQEAWFKQYEVNAIGKMKNWLFPIAMAETFYPSAGDGVAIINGAVWDTLHDTSASDTAPYTSTDNFIAGSSLAGGNYDIQRSFFPFNTGSIISDGATINSATLNLYLSEEGGTGYSVVVETSQASETSLTTGDYDQCGTIDNPDQGSDQLSLDITLNAYNTWTLNATGRGWIKGTTDASTCGLTAGYTCLGVRTSYDVLDTAPSSGYKYIWGRYSEYAGTGSDPYLEVDWSEGEPPAEPPTTAYATSTGMFIEKVYYTATSTTLADGTIVINGEYEIPFLIYLLVLSVFSFTVFICFLILYIVKK